MDKRTSEINEMNLRKLRNILAEFGNNVSFEFDLKKKSWFNIGGKSKVFFKAESLKELIRFLKKLKEKRRFLF